MAEEASGDIEIQATPAEVMEVIADFEAYPSWAQGVKKTEVRKTDQKGRATEVYMEVGQMGFNASYTLKYKYKAKDGGVTWTSSDAAGAVKSVSGGYDLEPAGDDATRVTFRTAVDLAMPVPGMIKRQAEKTIIDSALKGLKKRVEKG